MLLEYPMPFSYSSQFMKHHYTAIPYQPPLQSKTLYLFSRYALEYLQIPVKLASLTSPPTLPLLVYAAAGSAAGSTAPSLAFNFSSNFFLLNSSCSRFFTSPFSLLFPLFSLNTAGIALTAAHPQTHPSLKLWLAILKCSLAATMSERAVVACLCARYLASARWARWKASEL